MRTETEAAAEARERFFAQLEAELADEIAPTEDERRLAERLAAEDAECAELAAALTWLRSPEPVPQPLVERALAEREASRAARRRGVVAVLAAGIAAAAVAIVAVQLASAPPTAGGGAPAAGGAPLLAEDGSAHAAGDILATSGSPVLLESAPGLSVAVDRSSRVAVVEAAPEAVALRLARGRVALHLRPDSGRGVKVITSACEVIVTGTVFSVAVDDAEVRVDVVRGSVLIARTTGEEIARVRAGERFSVERRERAALAAGDSRGILALLHMPEPASEPPATAAAQPTDAAAPIADEPGSGSITPAAARRTGPPAETDAPREGDAAQGPAATTSPSELIRAAREHLRAREWAQAAETYRRITSEFAGRPEATTVRVPLADVELDHLGQPAAALADYERYLAAAPNGPLAEDAWWGSCVALGRLGRTADQRQALAEFLRRFPQSIHAGTARERLSELEKR